MISKDKRKWFLVYLLMFFLLICLFGTRMDRLNVESSKLANFLISNNSIKFIFKNPTALSEEEIAEVAQKYPQISIMTLQNRGEYKCMGIYSESLKQFEGYILEGRGFRKEELKEGEKKVLIGKNILNSMCYNVKIVKDNSKTYAIMDKVSYEVIGIIGVEEPSSLDNLAILSISDISSNLYYLDSTNKKTVEKAFSYLQEKYNVEQMEKKSTVMDSVIKIDLQVGILNVMQACLKMFLIIVMVYLSCTSNRSMIYTQYMLGMPLSFTIMESCKSICICCLVALMVIPVFIGLQITTAQDTFFILYKFVGGGNIDIISKLTILLKSIL